MPTAGLRPPMHGAWVEVAAQRLDQGRVVGGRGMSECLTPKHTEGRSAGRGGPVVHLAGIPRIGCGRIRLCMCSHPRSSTALLKSWYQMFSETLGARCRTHAERQRVFWVSKPTKPAVSLALKQLTTADGRGESAALRAPVVQPHRPLLCITFVLARGKRGTPPADTPVLFVWAST
jgi:hypothetical protein